LKNYFIHKIPVLLLIIFISSCSTKNNTWGTRAYKATNTRFNVFFNGKVSYDEGLKNIHQANKEDYSTIIPMYPISRHSNATAAASNMDRTIEKCRKAIKLHSIKQKPEKDLKKWNTPEYKLFYNQNEFNPALKDAWMLLAQAEFHKGDFLGSVGTFTYITRHFSGDKDMVAQCQLWIVRAYGEMGWIYEAEQVLSKIEQDHLKRSNIGLLASVNADLLLKKKQYKEAIPFLELALTKESDKVMQQRFGYLLAQLYQKTNDNKAAYDAFTKVIKQNPPFEMDFNARINRTQLNMGNVLDVRKELRKMLKNSNNKDYLDQLYYALGNTYLINGDTIKALENFVLSTEKSTRNGLDKAVTLIKLGDLYYDKKNYVLAQPAYEEASKIITYEQDDYPRVSKRAEVLSELVFQNEIVVLQDSLLRLAQLPENKRLEVVNKIIEKVIADEKAAAELAQNEALNANRGGEEEFTRMPPIGIDPMRGIGDWYFYNQDLMRSGQNEFTKRWGRRKLEDNWRRLSKATSVFGDERTTTANTTNGEGSESDAQTEEVLSDNKNPEFYLKQIPLTVQQKAKSNAEIATSLYAMGLIYKDKIEDLPLSISTFEEFARRFGTDERVPDAYFQIYLMQTRLGNQADANLYRTKLISDFPNTKYQQILSQPDYSERLERMYREQDSIYTLTYKAYNESDFKAVSDYVSYIQKNYPLSTLMPKFLFLNALSIGKKDSSSRFEEALSDLVSTYPESDVSAMAKDILALMKQGQEAQTGTSHGTLLSRRDEIVRTETNEVVPQQFSMDLSSKHRLLLISSMPVDKQNQLLYQIASFNFSRFMIKDFDLAINKLDSIQSALSVTNLESYDEADWYAKSIDSDPTIAQFLNNFSVRKVIISEENFALLRTKFSLADYAEFQNKLLNTKPVTQIAAVKPVATKKQEPAPVVKTTQPKPTAVASQTKQPEVVVEKPVEKVAEKTKETTDKSTEKQVEKPIVETKPQVTTQQPATTPVVVQPKQDDVPLFKNLFGYRANEPHYVAIYIVSGTIDFEKTKAALDAYNAQNYAVMNLKVSLEKVDKQQIIIIGSLTDANVAKSYLLRMVKERALFEGLKGSNYRNLIGSQQNLNVMMQQNAMNTYFEFMQEYYLK
jgi:tetratricopeptide (TPR) repeat protein